MTGGYCMRNETFWRKAAQVFDERAAEYDAWFDESLLFAIELAALQELATPLLGPKLEIGVGPGRFAEALGVEFGVDPALAPLALAKKRGVRVSQEMEHSQAGLVSQAGFAILVAGAVP